MTQVRPLQERDERTNPHPQVDYPIVVNGIVAFGGIFAGINPAYTQFEIAHAIKTAKIKAFISEPDIVQDVLQPAKDAGIPEALIFVFNRPNQAVPVGLQSWTTLLQHGEEDWVRFDDVHTSKRTEAARLFSSGTTGLPKAARISHYNFVAQHTCAENPLQPPFPERRLVFSPLFHAGLVPRTHFAPLRTGAQFYVMRRYEPEAFLQYVQRYQITCLGIPPALVGPLLSEPAVVERGALRSVKSAGAGAAPLSGEMQARLKKYLGEGSVFVQYVCRRCLLIVPIYPCLIHRVVLCFSADCGNQGIRNDGDNVPGHDTEMA